MELPMMPKTSCSRQCVAYGFDNLFIEPYDGTRDQRQALRTHTSQLIGRYVNAVKLGDSPTGVSVSEEEATEVRILKQITRDYVIANPAPAAQQHGHEKIVEFLFKSFVDAVDGASPRSPAFLPHRLKYLWDLSDGNTFRFAADCVASLTEKEAISLYARLSGASSGSVLDPIVR
jgi:dGTPase